ncbi:MULTISPECIES: LuxR C-terminal-related transcriptional regulator [unclassified Mycobacterium]|uniref:LuxR C-terminal-related transcriptional regulator n=1 Tax=unclassified Mycobacterium TaxID=2642494 RepID=UPI0029C9504C|nr:MULTISPECIES: LuxR C-terminal-related transcriptional regulator [unclassified Mycobacterium]
MRLTWPLTGRVEELRVIQDALAAPDTSGMVVFGAAGVGKSRIARDALSSAASRGCEIRWAVGTSSAQQLPLGAFAAWAGSDVADRLQLVRGVIDSLTSTADDARVIVGVDDVHLLDDLSTFVLHQIVTRRAAKLVLTVRDGDPISAATQEIWHIGQFDRLDLRPLSRDESTALLSVTLDADVDMEAARRLWKLTRGNVLYLRTIVEHEVAEGRLVQRDGYWRWTGEPVVPPSLAEAIEARIGSLAIPVGDVIDALAVGEPIELESLVRIADAVAVEDAETRDLITIERAPGRVDVRLAHPLYGEVRRGRAPSTRLRRLRGRVAAELAGSDRRDDIQVVVRRAVLSLDSDVDPDPALLVTAARGALGLADLQLADRLAEAAMRAGGGAEAAFVRAIAPLHLSHGEEADAALASIPTTDFTSADHARLAFMRAATKLLRLADPAGAKKLIDDASQAIPSGDDRSCIDAFLTVYWAAMGRPEAATDSSNDLVLEELPDFVAEVTARAVVYASGDAGRTSEAVAAAFAGYGIAQRSFDAPHLRFSIADGHIGALLQSGRVREACDVANLVQQQAAEFADSAQSYGAAALGRTSLGAGQLDTACSLLGSAVASLSASGETFGWRYRFQLPYTIALAMRGLTDQAVTALAMLDEQRRPSWRLLDYELGLAKAWVAASQGAVSEAISSALAAAETAGANGQFAPEVLCLQVLTQFGDHSGAARLRELAAMVEGPRVGVAARFAEALQAGDGAELVAVSEEFEQMGDLVAAVDAAAHAAMACRRQGLRGSGLASAARAEALAERCGGASTPALGRAAERSPLTAREQEIVALIGEGLSNRALAERLNVSLRTIEGHIYRAMAKTGATDRDKLAAMLSRRRPKPSG